jgi:hypothetical protein
MAFIRQKPTACKGGSNMQHRQFRTVVLLIVVVAMATVSFLAGRAFIGSRVSRAQGAVSPSAPAGPDASFTCTNVNNVAAFDNRIHLRCSQANGSVLYYAYPTNGSNGYTANRMLAVAQTAFALGNVTFVYYDADSSHNPPGCNASDCRLLVGISIVQ